MDYKLKHKNSIEVGDILKFRETGEFFELEYFYEEGEEYYALFGGFAVPKLRISSFFESTLVDVHVY